MEIETNYSDQKANEEMKITVRTNIVEKYIRKDLDPSSKERAQAEVAQYVKIITEIYGTLLAEALHYIGAGTRDQAKGIRIIEKGLKKTGKELTTLIRKKDLRY